jgi:hypothetical protein
MFGGTMKQQEQQQIGTWLDELKLVLIKTQLDSLHQKIEMQKELI